MSAAKPPPPKSGLDIKKVEKKLNTMQYPIYSMTQFRNFVILGGGGGNEIENVIQVYKYS